MAQSGANQAKLTAIQNNRLKKRSGYGEMDLPFFIIVITLLVIGIVMMFSASYAWAIDDGYDGTYYAYKQTKMAGIGLVTMFIASYFDYHTFQKTWCAAGLFGVSLVMLVMVLVMGTSTGTGVTRWLQIGPLGFQPSEIMKFAVIVFFSMLISRHYDKMDNYLTGVVPFFAMLGIIAFLMLKQPHLSGTILIVSIGLVLMLVGGVKIGHLLATGGVAALFGAILLLNSDTYFNTRITTWLDPFNEATRDKETWQTCESLIAIGSGGLFGLGLGESRQKYLYLPETKNDFVFSIVCEELGFVGAVVVVLLFALLVFRGLYIASRARDKFGMLVAVGLTVQIGLQAFINIAVASNLIPNTGISLPLFSYGGTALVMQLAEIGIILNISRQAMLDN